MGVLEGPPLPRSVGVTITMVMTLMMVTIHQRFTECFTNNMVLIWASRLSCELVLVPLIQTKHLGPRSPQVTGGAGSHPVPGSLRPRS